MNRFSWSRVGRLVRKEFRQLLRDPKMRSLMFVSPLIQLVLFGYAVQTDIRNLPMAVVDHDQSASSRALLEALTASGYFRVVLRAERSAALGEALDRGQATLGVEVPAGFEADLRAGRGAVIQGLLDGTDSNTGTIALSYASRIVQRWGESVAATRIRMPIDFRPRAWYNPALESRVYNVPAIVGLLLLLLCLLMTALSVVREREMGTLDQLLVSPIRPAELMLGKTIPVACVALVNLVLISATALLWFDIPFRGNPVVLLAGAGLYILAGLSLGLLLSTVSLTQQEAFMSMFLFLLPMLILSGFMFPVTSMPRPIQLLTMANPVRHFLVLVRGVFLKGAGFADLQVQFTALGLMAAGGMLVGVWRFRKMVG